MTPVSATMAIGACALTEKGLLNPLMAPSGLDIPSCEAVVGTLMKGIFSLDELNLATSIFVPPPTPRTICGCICLIFSLTVLKSSTVEEVTIT